MLKLNQEAKEFLEATLNDVEVFPYVVENFVLPDVKTKLLEKLIPELDTDALYDATVSVSDFSFSVHFVCIDDSVIECVQIPRTVNLEGQPPFRDATMQKFSFEMAWMAIKTFESGIPLCIREGEDRFTRITTAPDVLRYLYRLYVEKKELHNVSAISNN